MIRKMLVANRGVIACRIITTCREMGIATVAVYSEDDKYSRHVRLADEAVKLNGQTLEQTYHSTLAIIEAAKRTRVDAIHPGYGLLAENAAFAYAVKSEQIIFIGPSPESIEVMTNKHIAKLVLKHIHFLPTYVEDIQSDDVLIAAAQEMGFPLKVRASAGTNKDNVHYVNKPHDLEDTLKSARQEAIKMFGDGKLTLEKSAIEPRHICIQLMGDHHGKMITIGEQDCTIRRNHQIIIAESPSAVIKPSLREQMSVRAIDIANQLGFYSAGTIEFLLDAHQNFYFISMKPGLHMAYGVTELVYGMNLIRWQIQIARGVSLAELLPPFTDTDHFTYEPYGYAVQANIYTENPDDDFKPTAGTVFHWETDTYTRTDHGIVVDDVIRETEDNIVAKVIAHAETRLEAIRHLDYSLSQTKLLGIQTNIPFLRKILLQPEYLANIISTDYIIESLPLLSGKFDISTRIFIATAIAFTKQSAIAGQSVVELTHQNQPYQCSLELFDESANVQIGGNTYSVSIWSIDKHTYKLSINDHTQTFTIALHQGHYWIHTIEGIFVLQCRVLDS